jgi:biotin synthase
MSRLSNAEARQILDLDGAELQAEIAGAFERRERRHGRSVNLCWIVNAKSGSCGQDCAFCSQSSGSTADIPRYELLPVDEIVGAAHEAAASGAVRFSIVTSGRAVRAGVDLDRIVEASRRICDETGLDLCASLGCVDSDVLRALKHAGVTRYHHNVETCESFWSSICTTRPYSEQRRVIRDALDLGLEVCSGGIVGLGESLDQRVELLDEVRRLDVHSVALNFFVPIPGAPLAHVRDLDPLSCLRVVVAARLMMPRRDIRVCGGREHNLRDLQPLLLLAGASGLMVGGYLTTPGRPVEEDLQMIRDLGLIPDTIPGGRATVSIEALTAAGPEARGRD